MRFNPEGESTLPEQMPEMQVAPRKMKGLPDDVVMKAIGEWADAALGDELTVAQMSSLTDMFKRLERQVMSSGAEV